MRRPARTAPPGPSRPCTPCPPWPLPLRALTVPAPPLRSETQDVGRTHAAMAAVVLHSSAQILNFQHRPHAHQSVTLCLGAVIPLMVLPHGAWTEVCPP